MATLNHHTNPNPLTVPFYPGEDGNFYASPGHIQTQQQQANDAEGSGDIQSPTGAYYRYSVQDDVSDVTQATENVPHIISTSESYIQPHSGYINSKGNARNHGPYDSSETTPFPMAEDNANPLHSVLQVVTNPSPGSKPPRRGAVRNRQRDSLRVYVDQTMGTHKSKDNTGTHTYYSDTLSHPFTATASRGNKYQYQEADMSSTEFTPVRQVSSLTQRDTKQKQMDHSHTQVAVEDDTTKPLRDVKNGRIKQRHKPVITDFYTSTTETTEYLSTSSTTQNNGWETYNSWQGTTPYQKEVSYFELTVPTQPKHKVTDKISGSRLNSELDYTTPTLAEYTTVKLTNIPDPHSTSTPVTYSGIQMSTRPTNELLESIYDIANTMFKPQYDTVNENVDFEPSSLSANQDSFTELVLPHPNIATTTVPSTTSLKSRYWRPVKKISRPPTIINNVTKYTTSSTYHTIPETYTIRHRPSNDHPSLPVRHRIHRPQTMSLQSTIANVITTALPSNDTDTTLSTGIKSPSRTRSQSPVTPRRLRRPTKTRVDMTSTKVYADSDKSESFERPLQDVNRLNKKPQGSTMTAPSQRYSSK
ncbi:hypothetical protein L798_00410 [Zootermopsis nevadensis]|uniref:Uncharacterized protein n=1 Tax=Zootermopsis nevadensis TaxID=136037 RepID=A0A067QV13_ZOONE|nr:hypothetical protein L798_00410 [Zootermopsis nevadensis]